MSARIRLTPTEGPLKGQAVVFTDRTLCTVGRSPDCFLRLNGSEASLTVSRRHCLLDIDPPTVRVRDLGSLNGTYVNGRKIGQREKGTRPAAPAAGDLEAMELHDGDRLVVGDSEFVVGIEDSPFEGEPDGLLEFLREQVPGRTETASGSGCAACC